MHFGGIPFGFGGMPGMGERPNQNVDTEGLYKVLEVKKDATADEIRKAFKKLAIKHHPDKGGDEEDFKKICKAYEILSNPEKRETYDQYGEAGLESNGGGGSTGNDLFEMFFGGHAHGGGNRQRRGEDITTKIEFTLEQFFTGASRKLAVNKDVICSGCDGHGGPADSVTKCSICKGTGVCVVMRRMGPMIQQSQSPCSNCKATGKVVPENKKCTECRGKGITRQRKIVEVTLPRGAKDGHPVVFSGEADQSPGIEPGNLVFICIQKPHPVFKRNREDLYMEHSITLREALTGTAFFFTGLDGEKKYVQTAPGQIIKPGDVLAIENEGLSKNGSHLYRGNIYVKFDIEFPESLDRDSIKSLLRYLPGLAPPPPPAEDDKVDCFELKFIDPESSAPSGGMGEDDDEEGGGPGGVQCRQA